MAGDVVIRAQGLGKQYLIGHQAESEDYVALRDVIARAARNLARTTADVLRGRPSIGGDEVEAFWALRDVTFEVGRGEVVGVIGRNGAGKSTLLKVLSRITEPTCGRVEIKGRVASLLEVGTGFHPELTGRENIYLNGAILGMSHAEIRRKFDEIVAFAEIEKFLDTPVKRYSSGMYVRLAFAVAAHLEPEILVIDEVLAVGDAEFQKKCLGKMGEVASHGRTVLFVSHNMAAVEHLCPRSMLLERGRIIQSGSSADVISAYVATTEPAGRDLAAEPRSAWARPWIVEVRLVDPEGVDADTFAMGAPIRIRLRFTSPDGEPIRQPSMGVIVKHLAHGTVGGVNTRMTGFWPAAANYLSGDYECVLSDLPLIQGSYCVDIWLSDGARDVDCVESAARFQVREADVWGTGATPFANLGTVFLKPVWSFQPTEAQLQDADVSARSATAVRARR